MRDLDRKFEEHLLRELDMEPGQSLSSAEWAGAGNTIGDLALRLGLLTLDHLDHVLE